jgi:NAD(P)-dependent dehydrogenase (short-subunit alcohol dehydrogenase family)
VHAPHPQFAVVTGAGTGIGRATALELGRRGLHVVCVGRRREPLEETLAALDRRGRATVADVGTEEGVAAVVQAVGDAQVAALLHVAAIDEVVALADTDRATFDRLVAANLAGPFFLTRALVPRLAVGSGVVFVGSIAVEHGRASHAAYAATKAGLLGLTRNLAVELAPSVRVNCLVPGAVDTPRLAEALDAYLAPMGPEEAERARAAEMARLLLGRLGQPAEIAASIVHLALDATYSTGSVVTVDGGITAR